MKLPPFDYKRPSSIAEAIGMLVASGDGARLMAGGQSLMPMLAFRLASPSVIVDLTGIKGLDRITIDERGVRLGALVRWRQIEDSAELKKAHPLLCAAIPHIAHYQIRSRGTVGGSLAHADPASELPCLAVTCEAEVEIAGVRGERKLRAAELAVGPMTTTLKGDEIVTGVSFPFWPAGRRWGFEEFAKRRGDFALAGIALYYDENGSGKAANAHIGVFGASSTPRRLVKAEAVVNGRRIDELAIKAAAEAAAGEIDPPADIHASPAYRRALVAALIERALARAAGFKGGSC